VFLEYPRRRDQTILARGCTPHINLLAIPDAAQTRAPWRRVPPSSSSGRDIAGRRSQQCMFSERLPVMIATGVGTRDRRIERVYGGSWRATGIADGAERFSQFAHSSWVTGPERCAMPARRRDLRVPRTLAKYLACTPTSRDLVVTAEISACGTFYLSRTADCKILTLVETRQRHHSLRAAYIANAILLLHTPCFWNTSSPRNQTNMFCGPRTHQHVHIPLSW
jgi:hypothetical protein